MLDAINRRDVLGCCGKYEEALPAPWLRRQNWQPYGKPLMFL
jgi:hypothetical protein